MLWALCARPKPWIFSSLFISHSLATRFVGTPTRVVGCGGAQPPPRLHSNACHTGGSSSGGGAALIWHAILPSDYGGCRRPGPTSFLNEQKGEGSWNVAWDVRPARWLHHSDSAWFLFGVCACLSTPLDCAVVADGKSEAAGVVVCSNESSSDVSAVKDVVSPSYRVRGVPPDGRCLFRSIAHLACLRNGEEAPDENRQRELADELRAQVVEELLRRREDSEWFIEGDFDAYVRNIQKPSVWGGEPELMMACHVLRTSISIFAIDRTSGSLVKIADYGEEYRKDKEKPMTLMYHWYGHYDILEGDVSNE